MTQGAPVLAGMANTASQTTDITLNGPNPGLSVSCGTPVGSANTAWAGIAANSVDVGSDALYGIGRGRGVYAVGLDGEGVRARSYQDNGMHSTGRLNGVKGTTANPAAAGVWGENTASGQGVLGTSEGGNGVLGRAMISTSSGVLGVNTGTGAGVSGTSALGIGVSGRSVGGVAPIAILGENASGNYDGAAVVALGGAGVGLSAAGARAAIRLNPNLGLTGAPTTGLHLMGELVVDKNGDLFLCKADGTPGTWVRVA